MEELNQLTRQLRDKKDIYSTLIKEYREHIAKAKECSEKKLLLRKEIAELQDKKKALQEQLKYK